jgi:hypothetical protein
LSTVRSSSSRSMMERRFFEGPLSARSMSCSLTILPRERGSEKRGRNVERDDLVGRLAGTTAERFREPESRVSASAVGATVSRWAMLKAPRTDPGGARASASCQRLPCARRRDCRARARRAPRRPAFRQRGLVVEILETFVTDGDRGAAAREADLGETFQIGTPLGLDPADDDALAVGREASSVLQEPARFPDPGALAT